MAKKLFLTLSIIAFFASCGTRRNVVQNPATFDEGVVINGVRWATRNVDMPGTFAETPESFGMLFQWNRKKGWSATDNIVDYWGRIPEGTKWYAENDPCPEGWRVPTREELKSLYNAKNEWGTLNDVNGHYFGTKPNQIFLPAVGFRCGWNRTLGGVGIIGNYWSNTQEDTESAIGLGFLGGLEGVCNYVGVCRGWRLNGNSIRCVAK